MSPAEMSPVSNDPHDSNRLQSDILLRSCRINAVSLDLESKLLEFYFIEDQQNTQILNLDSLSQKTQKQVLQVFKYLPPPINFFAHHLEKLDLNWQAQLLVLLPDYLIDVTAIASCYHSTGNQVLKHLVSTFWAHPSSFSMLVGTSVNLLLDELILNPLLSLDELINRLFKQNPLAFSLFDDLQVEKFYETVRQHFYNVKKQVDNRFENDQLNLSDCLLEPSFYSIRYGIQGRLDVLYENKKEAYRWIIELKSGKPFLPNKYGLNADHHAQTILYYLLIQSVYGTQEQVKCHVLYSSQSEQALRYAPADDRMIQSLMEIRNSIILMQLHFAFRKSDEPFILDQLNVRHFDSTESFTKRDGNLLLQLYNSLNPLEKDYLKEFSGFVAREQYLSKLGRSNVQYTEGLATLWLLSEEEKIELFIILPGLEVVSLLTQKEEYPILVLKYLQGPPVLSNFRVGDTLVLYQQPDILQNQVYKCTLIEQFENEYHVRLRTRQFPQLQYAQTKKWNLEHDSMDRNFITQFQGLFEFCQSEMEQRQLLLGLRQPDRMDSSIAVSENTPELTRNVIAKILTSKDYFLLWGPPGSGKTSMVIKYLTESLFSNSDETILLLAYTNRAVDEICEAIESIDPLNPPDFIRIGSRYAVHPKFRKNLLEEKISAFKTRNELQKLLQSTRIYTATLASIQGKKELFQLKQFNTVIIDEASQILESQLIGLLTKFKRFILIGDPVQLPAVTPQTEEESKIQSPLLREAGFRNLSVSYFERMLQNAKQKNWHHCFDMLQAQGRMHSEIMEFPSRQFYENNLCILPGDLGLHQTKTYLNKFLDSTLGPAWLMSQRRLFINCNDTSASSSTKVNPTEARLVALLAHAIYQLYKLNQLDWNAMSLGIITPFRAQIALIKRNLQVLKLDTELISVDTAERYQGGSRDIILLSTVISDPNQLNQISSINSDGIDRKLNVALTRAREQIILVGNKTALSHSKLYQELIESYHEPEDADQLFLFTEELSML